MSQAREPRVDSDPEETDHTEMSPVTLKHGTRGAKKRRIVLTPAERAGLDRIRGNPKPATPEARKASAEFRKFQQSNPGW